MTSEGKTDHLLVLDDQKLEEAILAAGKIPRHVAIIMDGNGRWAKKRFLPRIAGHRAGRHAVRRCVDVCGRLGVEVLTLYTFSLENFNRPKAEVKGLWYFLQETLAAERDDLHRQNVRLVATGALDVLPGPAHKALTASMEHLGNNTGLVLNLALAYGGRQEILHAALIMARKLQAGELTEEQCTEEEFSLGMYSPDLPDPDLVVRTSGEGRLSNFLLWESAYAEMQVTSVLWPDFSERDMLMAIADYQFRERRFGALPEADKPNSSTGGDSILDPKRWKRLLKVKL